MLYSSILNQCGTLSSCRPASSRGLLLDWEVSDYERVGARVSEVERRSLCRGDPARGLALLGPAPFDRVKAVCDALGGRVPTLEEEAEAEELSEVLREAFVEGKEGEDGTCQVRKIVK